MLYQTFAAWRWSFWFISGELTREIDEKCPLIPNRSIISTIYYWWNLNSLVTFKVISCLSSVMIMKIFSWRRDDPPLGKDLYKIFLWFELFPHWNPIKDKSDVNSTSSVANNDIGNEEKVAANSLIQTVKLEIKQLVYASKEYSWSCLPYKLANIFELRSKPRDDNGTKLNQWKEEVLIRLLKPYWSL